MNFELTASMMCADYAHLETEVKNLEEGGIDSFHIDIMDGRYVPNYAMSLNDMRYIASATEKPLDVHLMVEHPNNTIGLFLENLRKGDTVYIIHPEAECHPLHDAVEDYQRGHDTGHRNQPRHLGGDRLGNVAHRQKGAGDVGQSWKCRADVPFLCREEDHKIVRHQRGYGLGTLLGRCLQCGANFGIRTQGRKKLCAWHNALAWQE